MHISGSLGLPREGLTHVVERVEAVVYEERRIRPQILLLKPLQHLQARSALLGAWTRFHSLGFRAEGVEDMPTTGG